MAKAKKSQSLLDLVEVRAPQAQSKNPRVALEGADAAAVDAYADLYPRYKELEAEKEKLNAQVKDVGQTVFSENAAAGTFENPRLVGDDAALLFIVQDSYNAVSEEKKAKLESAGLGDFVERSGLQLRPEVTPEQQQKMLEVLVKAMGPDVLKLFAVEYRIKKGALKEYAQRVKDPRKIKEALLLMEPRQQVRV